MKFDDFFIEQVRNSISIVDLISGYVHLKKKGKDYGALCPFHQEKTPSFLVSESKRIFKCFGCGAGGDIFKFVMLIENLTFPESVQHLAERYGIPLPRQSSHSEERNQSRQRLVKIMEFATEFFCRNLEGNQPALGYLSDRGISEDMIKRFSLGYAPPGQQLMDELKRQGFSIEDGLACGLLREGDDGRCFDKFRNRIVCPIRDLSGRTIAFGGRILGEGGPKYLNSPDTVLYSKGNTLFPLDVTRDEIRRRDFAILVEGYFDCIVPFQFGILNVVASLGTGLTENQVKLLGRYTRNVIINFDPDSAGTAAALRSIDLFLEQGFRVNVLDLPAGEDPDTFVRAVGAAVYREKLKASQPYFDFALSRYMEEQRDPFSPKGKQEIVSNVLPYLAKIPNAIERAGYVSRISSRLKLDEDLITSELRKVPRRRNAEQVSPRAGAVLDRVTVAEQNLLAALFHDDWKEEALDRLETELFEGLRTQAIFREASQLKKDGHPVTAVRLREALEDEADQDLLEAAALGLSQVPLTSVLIESSIQALREKQRERRIREVQGEIEKASDPEKLDELLAEKQKISKELSR